MSDESAVSSPSPTQEIQGIDVSDHQGTVDWNAVQQAGKVFVFIKATDGITWTDPDFAANWSGAEAAGLLRGAYHFYETDDDPTAQAQNFLNAVQLAPGDLPPVVDIERFDTGGTASQTVKDLQTWLDVVEQATGRTPIIYTSHGFWNSLGTSAFGLYPLWIAEYGVQSPTLPAGWASWTFWQFSESGTVAGISGSVDLNVFNGSLAELTALGG
jgi:lysozyme